RDQGFQDRAIALRRLLAPGPAHMLAVQQAAVILQLYFERRLAAVGWIGRAQARHVAAEDLLTIDREIGGKPDGLPAGEQAGVGDDPPPVLLASIFEYQRAGGRLAAIGADFKRLGQLR